MEAAATSSTVGEPALTVRNPEFNFVLWLREGHVGLCARPCVRTDTTVERIKKRRPFCFTRQHRRELALRRVCWRAKTFSRGSARPAHVVRLRALKVRQKQPPSLISSWRALSTAGSSWFYSSVVSAVAKPLLTWSLRASRVPVTRGVDRRAQKSPLPLRRRGMSREGSQPPGARAHVKRSQSEPWLTVLATAPASSNDGAERSQSLAWPRKRRRCPARSSPRAWSGGRSCC